MIAGAAPFIVIGLLMGLLYNTLFYPRTLIEYLEAATIGVLLGSAVGFVEQLPIVRRWFQSRSFAHALVVRTLCYSLAVALCLSLVLAVEPATLGECSYVACFADYVTGPLFVRDVTFSTGFVFVVALAGQIVFLIGPRNLGRLAIGRYQKPRELTADVMFVDLRGSTRLAELLGHREYSALLRDFFIDASRAVHEARGEIYQYVGDEMIIVWPDGRAAGRWLDCFVRVRASIDAQRRKYMARYSIVPEFKAGVHSGSVIVTEVGVLQRALVYHGDVLNTAARIQGKCNETEFDLLVSEAVWSQLSPTDRARFASIGPVTLKGKEGMVELYGLIGSRVVAAGARGEASRRGDTGSRDRGP